MSNLLPEELEELEEETGCKLPAQNPEPQYQNPEPQYQNPESPITKP